MSQRRTEVIVALLESYSELTDPRQSGNGGNRTGLTLQAHAHHCAIYHDRPKDQIPLSRTGIGLFAGCTCHLAQYRELDRLLDVMQGERRSQWWHLNERYLRCEHTLKTVRFVRGTTVGIVTGHAATLKVHPLGTHQELVIGKSVNWEAALQEQRHKRSQTPLDRKVLVAAWNPSVRMQKVKLGVDWLASSWALADEPALPADKLIAA